ncbi:MAG: adenylate/guanylate cyclase domain-containing protein [Zoogloeaceae bacterium]|nr:adenylate/guanylate cyclase domain-containing protein [Zoogloeaceae bacterium]
MVRRRVLLRLATLALASGLLTLAIALSPLGDWEDGAGLRLRYTLRGPATPPDGVLIVALDAVAAQTLALPERPDRWPRRIHAELLTALAARGAAVVGMDLLFAQEREAGDDQALADALRRAGNVVLVEALTRDAVTGPDGRVLATSERRTLPLPLFRGAAAATAPFVLPKTPDGVFEFWTHIPGLGDRPSLPAVMASRLGAPATGAARRALNLYGPIGTIPTLNYPEALARAKDPVAGAATFGGKAILIGLSESNQSRQADAYHTPFTTADGVDVSGVELCATALANLLDGSWLRQLPDELAAWLCALLGGLFVLPWGVARPAAAAGATLLLAGSYGIASQWAFAAQHLWLPTVVPLGAAPLAACGLGLGHAYWASQRRRIALEKAVELGLPRRALERFSSLLADARHGQTVFAVCLCSDIQGYTTLSEGLSPEATRDTLNRYFQRFVPIVEAQGGYVADLVGDSVMSLWVADTDPEAAFRAACAAALALDEIMNGGGEDGLPTRFGLHCGPIFLGEVGADGRQELRAVGDIVNTTSRIQGANKYFGTRILATPAIAAHLAPHAKVLLGEFTLLGKRRPLTLYALLRAPLADRTSTAFSAGLAAFQNGRPTEARAHFEAARADSDWGPITFYLDQCRRPATPPPGDSQKGGVALPGK